MTTTYTRYQIQQERGYWYWQLLPHPAQTPLPRHGPFDSWAEAKADVDNFFAALEQLVDGWIVAREKD